MPKREVEEQVQHDRLVEVLRREYYHYPSPQHPGLISFSNHPLKTKAVVAGDGTRLYPDIVVIEANTQKLVLVVEVETGSSVTPDEAEQWRRFSELDARFHLYFPRGLGPRVAELCRALPATELVQYWHEADKYMLERYR